MKPELISSTLKKMVSHKHLRKLLAGRIVDVFVQNNLIRQDRSYTLAVERYEKNRRSFRHLHYRNGQKHRYVDNIYELYENGKTLADAMFSDFMINGRKWQREYGLDNRQKPKNWLMPCSIRDHYEIFRKSVLPKTAKPEDKNAKEALESDEYFEVLKNYDEELHGLTENIWENEYLNV